MPLYKYLAEEAYARALIDKGQIFARPLSYFRAYEDELVRGDPDDGKLRYEPDEGLVLTKENGDVVEMPPGWRFRASVRADDIFVYCLSTELSPEIATKFECPFCVEINEPNRLLGRISMHVRLRSKLDRKGIYSRQVSYRKLAAAPGADWALPERVAFIKPESWAWQKEHRIVVGRKGAFAVENVECALEKDGGEVTVAAAATDPLILHVGNLSKIAKLHTF
ncbi:Hypothetical protein NGAL_HAMBI1145_26780 [Neorhizobium galegae bv. officinalis]|uniref:Uncharacterized protein n=1 Tax=Neorhizobium galegae bv. officinalis TaxID=323656 RepID=A0A0T7FJ74_NEOGA|nr:Hypothetical protein NGAL_HAMBI1145_26780 [Neorhizobium galegae bv. officinalis]